MEVGNITSVNLTSFGPIVGIEYTDCSGTTYKTSYDMWYSGSVVSGIVEEIEHHYPGVILDKTPLYELVRDALCYI